MPRARIIVHNDDVLVVNGYELDGEILKAIVSPDKRLLWAFIKKDHDIRPIAFSEDKVIWLLPDEVESEVEV